jgi:hypothetical protein
MNQLQQLLGMPKTDGYTPFLYIEIDPEKRQYNPEMEHIATRIQLLIEKAPKGLYCKKDKQFYEGQAARTVERGIHTAADGATSTNVDYLIIGNFVTHSLAPYYLRWYSKCIPQTELVKLKYLILLLIKTLES